MAKIRGCHIGPPICTSFSLANRVLMASTPRCLVNLPRRKSSLKDAEIRCSAEALGRSLRRASFFGLESARVERAIEVFMRNPLEICILIMPVTSTAHAAEFSGYVDP